MPKECKGCKGCRSYLISGCTITNVHPHLSETHSCPCLICLIKGMCRTECEAFGEYKILAYKETIKSM